MPAESLESLRDRIAELRVTGCRMSHERVRMENGAVLRVSRGGAEQAVVRIGLCSPEVRARNLACGHTMARYLLLDALAALHTAGRLPGGAHDEVRAAVESVGDAIHLLDHAKGEAERRFALASELEPAGAAAALAAEVRRLEEQHDAYAGQMRELRRAVLAYLD
ncbi:MAG: hypothetical protein ICV87_03240, partial [Gemmatimonadetes bacterium]|nr:hypothetical protein [Gemmatimonadota bacterium]